MQDDGHLPYSIRWGRLTRSRVKTPVVGTGDSQLLAANPNRISLLVSGPVGQPDPYVDKSQLGFAVSCAATGVKLSYVVPAGKTARIGTCSCRISGGAPTLQLQIVRAASTLVVDSTTTTALDNLNIELQSGDTIQWNCTAAIAATSADLVISVQEWQGEERVTLTFGPAAAVLDAGIQLYQGLRPVLLHIDRIGEIVRNEIRAISALASNTLSVVETEMLENP